MEVSLQQIDSLLDARELKKAEVLIARQLRAEPSVTLRADLLLRRARARLIGLHPDDALEDILTARALEEERGDTPEVLELLADSYFARFELSPVGFAERGDAEQALAKYQEIITHHPDYENSGWVYYQLGRVLLSAGQPEQASECLQTALLKPSHVRALTALCYERLGFIHLFDYRNPGAALSFLDKAATTYPPGEPEVWLGQLHILRSRALREQQEYPAALRAATEALTIMEQAGQDMRSGQQDAHLALGEILTRVPGRESEAVSHLQMFLQIGKKPLGVDVTWSRVNELLGDMLYRLERHDAAIDAYNNALSFNPYHPWQATLFHQIARCYYRLRAYEKTIATIERLLAAMREDGQDLSDYRVFHLLGNAYFALEHYRAASAAYQQAIALAPDQAEDLKRIEAYLRSAEELLGSDKQRPEK